MASGDDPLADMQNLMGYAGLVGPNPYSPFQGAIPFSGGAGPGVGFIAGWPTDAMGNPIQPQAGSGIPSPGSAQASPSPASTPGTTLNSMPAGGPPGAVNYSGLGQMGPAVSQIENSYLATPAGAAANANPNAAMIQFLQNQNQGIQSSPAGNQGGFGSGNSGPLSGAQRDQLVNNAMQIQQLQQQGAAQPAAASAAASGAMGPSGLTRQQYLSLLAHPGPVPTYGAAGPQAGQTPTGTPSPNVLQSFLNANSGKNSSFLNTLRGLQPGATS
jgi:hypothetical protein